MNRKQAGLRLAAVLLLAAIVMSACQQSVSRIPLATPTSITPTGLFVTPLTAENPMQMIEQFAQGTAAAQTATAGGGTPTTPQAVATGVTPQTGTTVLPGTPFTPTNIVVIATTQVVGTQVTAAATTPVVVGTLPTAGPKPASYVLQPGEFPYCIARRFNVNPDELLSLNGLTDGQIYYPNLTLKIPQTSGVFPPPRALQPHPTTYAVVSSDQTVYAVACRFGDVDPAAIAAANGIAVSAKLTSGQKLTIP